LEGHVSRSAVNLIHKGLGRRRANDSRMNPRAPFSKKRMLSHAECERPVTEGTKQGRRG